ncbi:MAG: polyprenyl synthetase family protein [Flavobacteriales bacterium]
MTGHRALFDAHAERWIAALPEGGLYEPMAYLLRLPAKRIRPVLTMMGCELFGGRPEQVLDEALGIELFHNFTLMHDDIMDAASLRRGMPTVHAKWNTNTAILSGDAMLVMAYRCMGTEPAVLEVFSSHALDVCRGQQLDMEFEQRNDVRLPEYQEMIRLKTAVLLAAALRIGAIKAGAAPVDQERIAAFGENLGLAFQLRDDLLDAFGDAAMTGKEQGGDLRNGKKTWLLIRGLECEQDAGGGALMQQLQRPPAQRDVPAMVQALRRAGVAAEAEAEVRRLEALASKSLEDIDPSRTRTAPLFALAEALRVRSS